MKKTSFKYPRLVPIIFLLIVGIVISSLSLSLVSAENKTVVAPGENFTLYFKCIGSNGGPCDATILCNITTISPDDLVMVNNQVTTRNVDSTYKFYYGPLNRTGLYQSNVFCLNESDSLSATILFEVSDDYTVGLILLLIVMSFIFCFYSFKMEEHIFLQSLFLFFGIFLLFFVMVVLNPMINNENLSVLINAQYYILLVCNILVFIYFSIYFIYNVFKNKKLKISADYDDEEEN